MAGDAAAKLLLDIWWFVAMNGQIWMKVPWCSISLSSCHLTTRGCWMVEGSPEGVMGLEITESG